MPQIIGEHTCEGKSKDKSIGFADNQQHYDGCIVNTMMAVSLISWEKDNLMLF
jgi:hypothetical protein